MTMEKAKIPIFQHFLIPTTVGRSIEFRLVVVKIDESSHYLCFFHLIFQLSLNHNKISYIVCLRAPLHYNYMA